MPAPATRPGLRVHAFSVAPSPRYFQPLARLADDGRIAHFGLHSLRLLAPWIKTVAQRRGLLRDRPREPTTWREAVRRVVELGAVRSADVAILAMEPYDARVALLLPVVQALRGRGVRVLYHTSWPYWDGDFVPRRALPGARQAWARLLPRMQAVCVNRGALDAMRARAASAVCIPHPVDRAQFFPVDGAAPAVPPFRWITVSRLNRGKGLEALVELFGERDPAQVRLTIVGDGPLESELRARAAGGAVEIRRFSANDLPAWLRQHHAFVLNSHRHGRWEELFGMTLIEAMACGLPVVSTDCVGPREFVIDGETGVLVPQRDTPALAAALRHLEGDAALRARLRANGARLVEQRHDLDRIAAQWLAALDGSAFAGSRA